MKKARQTLMMDCSDDPIPLYPHITPSNYDSNVVTSVCRVLLGGTGTPRLEQFWRKSINGIIAWRISKVCVQNPLFVGENTPYFFFQTNLPSPSPNEGRINGEVRQVAATLYKPLNAASLNYVTESFPTGESAWFRPKNYIDIDNIYVEIFDKNEIRPNVIPSAFWSVELEFLFVVNHCR